MFSQTTSYNTAACVVSRRSDGGEDGHQAVPDADQPDSAPHPGAALGQPPLRAVPGCWPAALWYHLRGAVLRYDLHLAGAPCRV